MELSVVYATFPDRETAKRLVRDVLEKRLAACATFWEAGSLYWWEGALEEATEAIALFKTADEKVSALVAALAEAHPYDVPCVVPLAAGAAHPPYTQWVEGEVHGVE